MRKQPVEKKSRLKQQVETTETGSRPKRAEQQVETTETGSRPKKAFGHGYRLPTELRTLRAVTGALIHGDRLPAA